MKEWVVWLQGDQLTHRAFARHYVGCGYDGETYCNRVFILMHRSNIMGTAKDIGWSTDDGTPVSCLTCLGTP